jgi:tRNA-(ms[2]io[6]A)-hydroxylase
MRPPLRAATPPEWVDEAIRRWPELLADHANCEKKAASTALALMFAYPEDRALATRLSKLAREELRHFEQVDKLMQTHAVPYLRRKPGRYAAALREAMTTHEPYRKLDLLLCGALIEARSCERFSLLSSRTEGESLPTDVAALYEGLQASEARHFELYLKLAEAHVKAHPECERQKPWSARLEELATLEAELATSPDAEFRFHSGLPQIGSAQS